MKVKFMLDDVTVEFKATDMDNAKKKLVEFFSKLDIRVRDFEYYDDDLVAVILIPERIHVSVTRET